MKAGKNIFLIFLFILVDQLSKYLIRSSGGFYICNKNIAFGISIYPTIFWIFWVAMILFIFYGLHKKYFAQNILPVMLVLSGALSNLIDRLYFSCVIDFIDLKFWPVFNLADTFITLGVIMLIIRYTRK